MNRPIPADPWRFRFEAAMWLAFAAVVASHTRADPDLFANVRFGLDMIDARAATLDERYAFTADFPFVNHEWLSEVVIALAWLVGGATGLVALKLILALAVWLPIDRILAASAAHLRAAGPLLVVGALSTWGNNLRAQSFSFVAFALLLWVLHRSTERPRVLWGLPVLFACWVNLHGGWLVGGLTLAIWTGWRIVFEADRALGVRGLAAGAASLLATLINPHGAEMLAFLGTTVGFSRTDITDWQPIHRAGIAAATTWAASLVVLLMALRQPGRLAMHWTTVLLVLAGASARVSRITVFFALAVVAVALPCALQSRPARRSDVMPRAAALAGIALALVIGSGLTWRNSGCIHMDAPWVPDIETSQAMLALPPGRIVPFFDWGHLVIWHRRGDLKVSMDGRRETVYGDATLARHHELYRSEPGAEGYPEALEADYVWLPRRFPVVARLEDRGWRSVAQGSRGSLLVRPGLELSIVPASVNRVPPSRCFPGP